MKLIFTIFGICSLLAWNAILSNLSFFIHFQSDYEPSVSLVFLNYSLNIIFQFLMIFKKQLFPLKLQLIVGILCSIISLIVLPFIVINFPENSGIGFILTAIVILFQGFVNAACCSGFFALSSIFPIKMIIAFSTGQGISGILMNIIEYIVLFSVKGEKDKKLKIGAIIFFSISGLILLFCFFILIFAYNTEYFKYYLEHNQKNEEETTEEESLVSTGEKKDVSFMQLIKMLLDINILTCFLYFISITLFPNVCFAPTLFGLEVEYDEYKTCTIVTIFNTFDTLGRIVIEKVKPTKKLTYIIVIGRSILIFSLFFNYFCEKVLNFSTNIVSIMLIVNVTILGLSNGMGNSLCMGIAPILVPNEIKGKAGSSVSFFIVLGIFLGSCLAFGSKEIIALIAKAGN